MANSFFQFKQFRVEQDRCAMKVSTDACLQGAWTPVSSEVKHVLDIGAGTGLLSLMLAQRAEHILVDAIELDERAAAQAEENITASPWQDRIRLAQGDVRKYLPAQQYDMVICNPPFFQNSLQGPDEARNLARHNSSLGLADLLAVLNKVLREDGYASVLLPYAEHETWAELLKRNRWNLHQRLFILPKADSEPNRVVSICSRSLPEMLKDERLVIYAGKDQYTLEAADLLSPFYLKL